MSSYKYINILFALLFCFGCSTQKDAAINRLYHQLNTKYNGLFYAKEYLKRGVNKLNESHQDNYSEIITVFLHADLKSAQSAQPLFDHAIQKATLAIKQHSMEIKGEEKNKLIDDAYLIIGQAKFFKQDYVSAISTFNYLMRKTNSREMAAEALLWTAKCQQQLNNQQTLNQHIFDLDENYILTKEQSSILFAIKAENEIKLKNYSVARENAIAFLGLTNNKPQKVRVNYILGQLCLLLNENNNARDYFSRVIKSNPNYELVFNAKLNRAKTFLPNEDNFYQLRRELEKMLADKKNKEYKDQIHFAIANMELKNNDTISAIQSLKKSATLSVNNDNQKIESHYILAKIFWKNQNYVESYNHCDSAHQLLIPQNTRYIEVKNMLRNSKKIAEQYIRINYNDSIINLAILPEEERNQVIDNYILELKRQDEEKNARGSDSRPMGSNFNSYDYNKQTQNSINITSGGGWYFYNPSAIGLGYSEFVSRWGNRKLEDNWRRKNKNQINELDSILTDNPPDQPSEKEKYSREYYLSKLPLSEEKRAPLFSEIETAYYDLSKIFKSDLQDYKMAISIYNELLERFPKTDYKQLAYVDLYNIYEIQEDTLRANNYLAKIEQEFPNSDYLASLKGGGSVNKKLIEDSQKYETIYSLYTQNTTEACSQIQKLKEENKDNLFLDKIELLSILCEAKSMQKGLFISRLEEIRTKHPNSHISNQADSIALVLKGELEGIIKTNYINEFEEKHYFILLLSDVSISLPELQSTIARFNQQYYQLDSLETKNMLLTKQEQIFRVGDFEDKTKALLYYEAIQENNATNSLFNNNAMRSFVISKNNFYLFLKEKNIDEYDAYFQAIYLLN